MNDLMQSSARESQGWVEKGRIALFGALYNLLKSMNLGERYFYFSTVVTSLQLIYLPFSIEAHFDWPDYFRDAVGSIDRFLSFGFISLDSSALFIVITAFSFAFALACLTGLIMLCNDCMRHENKHAALVPVVGVLLRTGNTILLHPVLVALVRLFRCNPVLDNLMTCSSTSHYILQASAAVVIFLFLMEVSLYALIVRNPVPLDSKERGSGADYCAPHGRVEFASTWIRGIVALCVGAATNGVDTPSSTLASALVVTIVLSGLALVSMYLYYLPFHKMSWNTFSVGCYSVYLWAGVSLILAQAVGNPSDYSSILVFTVALPFFTFSSLSLIRHRIAALTKTTNDIVLQSPYLVELRLRLLHQMVEKFEFTGTAEEGYRKANDAYPDSAYLCLYTASLVLQTGKKVVYALNLIRKARHLPLAFDLEFFLFVHNKANEERQSESSGAISFMEFDRHLNQAREKIIETLKSTARFWKKVATDCTVNDLIQDGKKIHEAASACRAHLKRLLKLSDSNIEAIRWYAIFTAYVMNDRGSATRILRRRDQGIAEGSGGYAVCTVSGNSATLGQILDCTDALCSLFGYAKAEMVGRNVKMLCPPPFEIMHDLFLKHFLTSDEEFSTKTRRIYGVHRSGYLIPLDFVITPSTNSNSDLILIGKFEEKPLPESQHLVLVDAKTGYVTSTSQYAPNVLDLDPNEVFALNMHITDIIPDFFNDDKSLRYKTEEKIQIGSGIFKIRTRGQDFKNSQTSNVTFDVRIIVVMLNLIERVQMQSDEYDFHTVDGDSLGKVTNSNEYDVNTTDDDESGNSNELDRPTSRQSTEQKSPLLPPPLKAQFTAAHAGLGGSPIPNAIGSLDGSYKLPKTPGQKRSPKGTVVVKNLKPSTKNIADDESELSFSIHDSGKNKNAGRAISPGSPSSPSMATRSWKSPRTVNGLYDGASQASSTIDGRAQPEAQVAHFQKRIMANLNKKDPQLIRFGRFAKRFFFGFTLIGILNAVLTTKLYDKFVSEVSGIHTIFEEAHYLCLLANIVYYFTSPPILSNGISYQRTVKGYIETLPETISGLNTVHGNLITHVESSGSSGNFEKLVFNPNLIAHVASSTESEKPISFHISVLDIIKHGEKLNNQNSTVCDDSCQYITSNALFDTLVACLEISKQIENNAFASIEFVKTVGLGFVIGVTVLLVGSFFKGFAPIIISQESHRMQVGEAFKSIPIEICNSLQRKAETRLSKLTSGRKIDLFEDDDDDEPLQAIDEMEAFESASPKFSGEVDLKREGGMVEANDKKEKSSGFLSFFRHGRKQKATKVIPQDPASNVITTRRKFKVDSFCSRAWRVVVAALNIGLTFWFVFGFFAATTLLDTFNNHDIYIMTSTFYVSGVRFVLFFEIAFWSAQEPSALATEKLRALLAEMKSKDYSLIYGNETLGLLPFKDSEGPQYTLFYENACDLDCTEYLSANENMTQDVEFLQYGCELALEKYFERSQKILSAMEMYLEGTVSIDYVNKLKIDLLAFEPHRLLGVQLEKTLENYLDILWDKLYAIRQTKVVGACILVGLLLVGHVISMKAFSLMDKNLKNTKTLLLMLPIEVFTAVPSMNKLLQENQI